jgi:hypothetical protein
MATPSDPFVQNQGSTSPSYLSEKFCCGGVATECHTYRFSVGGFSQKSGTFHSLPP